MRELLIPIAILLVIGGCAWFEGQASDPNSGLNQAVDTVEPAIDAIKNDPATQATPLGWVIGSAATILSAAIGGYKVYRKNLTIKNDNIKMDGMQKANSVVSATTKAIVDAVEGLSKVYTADGTTVDEVVKASVKEKLKGTAVGDLTVIGKSIITQLKNMPITNPKE